MYIKLKGNTDNKEFKEKSIEEYKSKGIIAMLLIIVIIATSALGMCAAYPLIEENAKNVSYTNYFDEYDFTEKLACTLYSSYYNSLNEKAGGTLGNISIRHVCGISINRRKCKECFIY